MIYEFAATQDLHGYSKPWAPGAGTNILPRPIWFEAGYTRTINGVTMTVNADGSLTLSETATAQAEFQLSSSAAIPPVNPLVVDDGTYTISQEGLPAGVKFVTSGGGGNGFPYTELSSTNPYATGSVTDGTLPFNYFVIRIPANTSSNGTYKFQLELGSLASAWTPYANICPPEGFNIWDPDNAEYVQVYAGYVNANTRELYLRPVYKEYAGEELVGPWMSSLDPYAEDTTPTEGAFVIDFGGELTSFEITPFMLQTLLDSLGIRQHFTDGAGLLNKLMDQAQGRVRSEEELLHLSRPLNVIAIGDQLPAGLTFKPISKDVLPGLPGKFIR